MPTAHEALNSVFAQVRCLILFVRFIEATGSGTSQIVFTIHNPG